MACAVETEKNRKKAQKTVTLSDSQKETSTDKVASLTLEPSSIRVQRGNLKPHLDEMTDIVQRMMVDVGKFLSIVSMKILKTYEDIVETVKLKNSS